MGDHNRPRRRRRTEDEELEPDARPPRRRRLEGTFTPTSPNMPSNSTPTSNQPNAPYPMPPPPPPEGRRIFAWAAGQWPSGPDPPQRYEGSGDRNVSLPVPPYFIDRNGNEVVSDAHLTRKGIGPNERKNWLEGEQHWKHRLDDVVQVGSWIGKKVLGVGGYGIVGLWEDEYSDKKVVVKQAGGGGRVIPALEREAAMLSVLGKGGSPHILALVADLVSKDTGGSHIPGLDEGDVARMYLEFCEGGDFTRFLKEAYKNYSALIVLPERIIWSLFKCLALGLVVMDVGSEALVGPKGDYEIVHFDIKPQNILVAGNDSTDHSIAPLLKFADFGLALTVPYEQDEGYLQRNSNRGTRPHLAPEQHHSHPSRRYGTATNVYQTGKVMMTLINRGRYFNQENVGPFFVRLGEPEQSVLHLVYGDELLTAPYSIFLRETVLRCMSFMPQQRPEPRALVALVEKGLAACGVSQTDANTSAARRGTGAVGGEGGGLHGFAEDISHNAASLIIEPPTQRQAPSSVMPREPEWEWDPLDAAETNTFM